MAETPKPMSIEGRLASERERLAGMSQADRAWRKQWLKDQELSHHEPRHVPELYKERFNPIRRAYRFPLDFLFQKLQPVLGDKTLITRWATGKILLSIFTVYTVHYYFKYNSHDWTHKKGWYVFTSRPASYPGDPDFPNVPKKAADDYSDFGFKKFEFSKSS